MDGGDTCKVEFSLGSLVATPAALRLMLRNGVDPVDLLKRHASGDWSEMEVEDQAANRLAASTGLRVFSAYWVTKTERVWVITEADRSFTTFLLPSEY